MQPFSPWRRYPGVRRTRGTLVLLSATLATVVALAGCGSGGSTSAGEPGSPGSPRAVTPVDSVVVPGPRATQGRLESVATELADEAAVTAYAGRLSGSLPARVEQTALPLLGEDGTLYAQTVFDGCGTPPSDSLTITRTSPGRIVIGTDFTDPPKIACFVAVRSVALVVLPS